MSPAPIVASRPAGVTYSPDGNPLSGMGSNFHDIDNDGQPDIWHTAVEHESFPLYLNQGKGQFLDSTATSDLSALTNRMTGWSTGTRQNDWHSFRGQGMTQEEFSKLIGKNSGAASKHLRNGRTKEWIAENTGTTLHFRLQHKPPACTISLQGSGM